MAVHNGWSKDCCRDCTPKRGFTYSLSSLHTSQPLHGLGRSPWCTAASLNKLPYLCNSRHRNFPWAPKARVQNTGLTALSCSAELWDPCNNDGLASGHYLDSSHGSAICSSAPLPSQPTLRSSANRAQALQKCERRSTMYLHSILWPEKGAPLICHNLTHD